MINRIPQPMTLLASVIVILIGATASRAEVQDRGPQVTTVKITDSIYMLKGRGGNIGLCIGDDGVFMIDDQYAVMTGAITQAVKELSEESIRFVLNTHWHSDHTGGNENLGSAGAVIVAHENVRKRMSTDQFIKAFDSQVKASPEAALPVVTFNNTVTFHWNGEQLHAFHLANAHTDGDTIIHFRNANVVHMGDIYFNGMYPFIDASSGGAISGVIAAVDHVLAMADEQTRIIPGHGELASPDDLRNYRSMLATVQASIAALIKEGRSRQDIVEAKPTAQFDEKWGGGFLKPDQWVGIVYDSMTE